MARFYLGTVEEPSIVKFYLMRRFKDVYFPQEESVVNDDWFDLYYISKKENLFLEQCFQDFMAGFQRASTGRFV
jgi:hypothetical protein